MWAVSTGLEAPIQVGRHICNLDLNFCRLRDLCWLRGTYSGWEALYCLGSTICRSSKIQCSYQSEITSLPGHFSLFSEI